MTVVDYKTGKTIPSAKDIETLRNIQLPTYLLAAKKMNPHSQIAGGILFQIRDESTINQNVVCCDADAKKEVFELGRKRPYTWNDFFFTTIETVLVQLKAHIDNAKFSYDFYPNPNVTPLKRQQSTCKYCGYRLVCRYSKRF
jgi:ATP-dependent helicase/DNAse subunit B